jgi:HEAT repeat protein
MPEFDDAVKLLQSPTTWCDGAARLAKLGDPDAVVPLTAALHAGHEASTLCLVDAIEALGGAALAHTLGESPEPDRRHAALDVILYLGTDPELPILESLAADPLPSVRQHTVKVIHQLKRTAAWRQSMFRLLSSDDTTVRAAIVDSLALDVRGDITTALRARLPLEPDPAVKAKIEAALSKAK